MITSSLRPSRLWLAALLIAPCLFAGSAAGAATWKMDPAKTRLGFAGVQTGSKFAGRFTRYDAAIAFDSDHLDASHIAVTVDLASAVTGDAQRDAALPGKDWLDIAQFPRARFETTAIRKQGANTYEAVGNLTLRGVTKPVTIPFTLQVDGAAAHAVGHATLTRTAFSVGQGAWASGQWVALEVNLDIDLVAAKVN